MRHRHETPAAVDWKAVDALGVVRLACDSRAVKPGDTFVAYPGTARDGRAYIAEALDRGAVSVLWERDGFAWDPRFTVPNVPVPDLRRHAGEIASRVYSRPSRRLWVVGVTGTNGKTTCSQWVAQALAAAGRRCAVIGTLGYGMTAPLRRLVITARRLIAVSRTRSSQLRRWLRPDTRAIA